MPVRRYGLDGRARGTLAELSGELGLSRERIRQIQDKAERTIKLKHENRGMRNAVI